MKKTFILIAIFMLMLPSCTAKPANTESAKFKMVSMAEGIELAKKNPDAIVVDVRRNDEYSAGHIPGAVLLTMETISAESAAKVLPDKNQMILIYCRSGRRSKIAAQSLLDLGYTNLIEFGGILDYTGEIEKGL
jgi:rhodanese-related sulfurtransferase